MSKALIISLGGTPEPLIKSIGHYQPDAVCFLTSQQSLELVGRVKTGLAQPSRDYKVVVDDPNDLMSCHQGADRCWKWLEKEKLTAGQVAIDFTGGTKVMSVALALLGILRGCEFFYVGGTERNKAGLGTVVTGQEQVFELGNPWLALAVEERHKGAAYFNEFQFAASAQAFAQGLEMIRGQKGPLITLLDILKDLATGYDQWDRFNHQEAHDTLKDAYGRLQTYVQTTGDQEAGILLGQVRGNLDFLDALARESRGFQQPCLQHLADLLTNAGRRASEGKFDDGVVRLYRALEFLGHLALRRRGIDPGKERLGLEESFRRLGELGDPLGQRFLAEKEAFQKVQYARNFSWLGHGTNVLKQDAYSRLSHLVLGLAGMEGTALPVFPRLPAWAGR